MAEVRALLLGTVGATEIVANVLSLGQGVRVTLLADYELANPRPVGFLSRPSMTGTDAVDLDYPRTISAGSTITVLQCESDALIAAGAATLA